MIRPTLWQRTHIRLRNLFTPSPAAERLFNKLDLYELEERIFLSATPIAPELLGAALDVDESVDVHDDTTALVASELTASHDSPTDPAPDPDAADPDATDSDATDSDDADHCAEDASPNPHSDETLVIVDTSVSGHEELLNSLLEQQAHDNTLHLLLLDANEDGVDQITRGLEQYDDLAAIHVLSHGTDGSLRLGSTWLDADHLSGYAGQISGWGDALAEGGDLLLYGCDLAASENGQALLEAIHALTGKDVAASIDTTGHSQLGGDWSLEFTLGHVTTSDLLSAPVQASWLHVMSSESVQDNFANFNYSGSDGTQLWSGDWSEIGELDGAESGSVQVAAYDLGGDGTHSLRLFAQDGVGIERAVNLENASTATLTFSWLRSELGVGFDSLEAQVSGDGGGSWTTLESITLGLDLTPNFSSHDISSYISANTHIRLLISGTGLGSIYLDDIHINYETAAAPGPIPPTNSAPVLNAGDPLSLSDMAEDNLLSAGTLVSDILTSAGGDRITDADSSAVEGIAVIGIDNTYGQWQYDATGSGDWQSFGAVANDKAVLLAVDSRVRFVPQADFSGDAGLITFRAWDQTSGSIGQTGVDVTVNGGETAFSTATDSASIQITAVNDAPVWTLPADLTVDEDTRLNIAGLSVADVDVATGELQVSLTVDHGALSLGATTGLTFSIGDGANDATLTFTGSLSDINAALATLSFQGGVNENGPVVLSTSVSDQGSTGTGGALSDIGSVNIDVVAVNDAPVWTLPADMTVDEDTRLNIAGLSVADVDVATGELQVSLTVDHGALSLGATTGLTFSIGDGANDATLTFTGALSDINAALATLSFQGGVNENGPVVLSTSVSDQGSTGTGGALSDIGSVHIDVVAVNDAPVWTLPADMTVDEDTRLDLTGLSVADVDVATGELLVSLSVDHGALSLGGTTGLTFSVGDGANDATLTFTGALSDINAALATLSFQGGVNENGPVVLSTSVSDQGNTGTGGALSDIGSVNIDVVAVNDAPVWTLPADMTVDEDTRLDLTGLSIADVDVATGELLVSLSVDHGALSQGGTTGLTFSIGDGANDATLTFTGTLSDINAALATLSFQGGVNENGPVVLSTSVSDQGYTGTGGALSDIGSVNIDVVAVNDAPVWTLPADLTVDEDTRLDLTGLSIADVDVATGELLVSLSVDHGALSLGGTTGLTFSVGDGANDATLTFTGTLSDINAALATLSFQGGVNENGPVVLSTSVSDQGNTGTGGALSDIGGVNIDVVAVNDAPVWTLPADLTVDEDTRLDITGLSVADVDVATGELLVSLSVDHGALSLGGTTGLTFSVGDGANDATLTFTGTLSDINAALATLSFQGGVNENGPVVLSTSVSDQGSTGTGGALSDIGGVNIDVVAVNDAPVWTLPADLTVDEDTRLDITGLSVADVDVATGELQVSLSVDHGALSLGGTTGLTFSVGDGANDATLTFTGTLSDINAALATLSFQGGVNENGPVVLSTSVSDQGSTGTGGALSDIGGVNIDVVAVNDAPVWTLPADLTVDEDTRLDLTGLSIADVDVATGELLVSLSVDHGALSLGGTTGLTFSVGDGASDATLTFTGSLSDINAALATLSFQGGVNENGPVVLSTSVSDQGSTGTGGALSDIGSVNIDVVAVNDAPTTAGLLDVVVNEDAPVTRIRLYDVFADIEDADNVLQYDLVDVTDADLFASVVIDDRTGRLLLRYAPNMHGESDITVRVTDSEGLYVEDTLHVTVNSVNDTPVAAPNNYALRGDETLLVAAPGLLQNDSDVDGDKLMVVLVRGPEHGQLIINRDGSFRYEPDPSYVGIDSFVYAASDGQAASELTPVFIKVSAPTSPIDSGTTTPIPKTNPNSPLSDLFLDVTTNLVSLLNQESPHTVTTSEATSPFALRANMTRENNNPVATIDPAASLGQLSLANLSDDLVASRMANRARSVDDVMEGLIATVEMAPMATVPELVTPLVALSPDELSDVSAELGESDYLHRWMVGSAVGLTTGLTVGYVLWTVRAGYLLTGLIAQVPAWRFVDPLPILNSLDNERGPGDGESLASIVQSNSGDAVVSA